MHTPDAALMAGPEALARFLETGDEVLLDGVFSAGEDVTILENFPPYGFHGQTGLVQWRALMLRHVAAMEELTHTFERAQDFAVAGDVAHFTLPTRWTGVRDGAPFEELGGWTFVQVREGEVWKIRSYGWTVVSFVWR